MIAVLPLFHVYGWTTTLALMKDGVKVVTVPKFTPETYINGLRNHRPTILMLVPPMGEIKTITFNKYLVLSKIFLCAVMFLYSHPSVKVDYLSSVRTVTSGAAPLGALDEEKLRQKVGKPLNVLQGNLLEKFIL